MSKIIEFPPSKNQKQKNNKIEVESSIVIIGANGSGKTKLGSWFEFKSPISKDVHRISAQKSLSFPNSVSPVSLEKAKAQLYYGYYNDNEPKKYSEYYRYKIGSRWNSKPETFLLNDYDKLLIFLFSDNYEEVLKYRTMSEQSKVRVEPPITKLDKIKKIWESLLPNRELLIESGAIRTKQKNSSVPYFASSMSDGERVVFYLIGECLCAPENSVIVIDEPELHLHHSLHRKLWDNIEKERDDCIFIYLTHDLEFATTRRYNSVKISINEYDGSQFDWFEILASENIPEDLYLEVLGSRSNVLFVEGTHGSHDIELYRIIYPNFTIKPVGSCETVLECVKSFNRVKDLHYNSSYGIVDRDYKSDEHVESFKKHNVFAPDFAEVENIFLLEEVLIEVARQLCIPNHTEAVKKIKDWIISEFDKFKDTYATEYTSHKINITLNGFDGNAVTKDQLTEKYSNLVSQIKIDDVYKEAIDRAEKLIKEKNYKEILKCFNHKGIVNQVGKYFNIKPSTYTQKVKDIIQLGQTSVLDVMKVNMPDFTDA